MGAIKTDTGAALADSMRDARELTGAMVRLCKGEPVERAAAVVAAAEKIRADLDEPVGTDAIAATGGAQ